MAEDEEKQSFLSDGCETFTDLEVAYESVKDPVLARRLKSLFPHVLCSFHG
jgi:hypothetical protein